MGKYDAAAKRASEAVQKEFAADIDELKTSNLKEMFPNQADRELVSKLIAEVQKATDRNEMIHACQVLGAKLTKEGAKALKEGFKIAKKLAL